MTVKTIQANGKTYKFGRRPFVFEHPRLKLKNYLMRGMPSPPATCDYSAKAQAAIAQMYLNDQLGDCVIAWMCHATGIFTGNATGKPVIASTEEVTSAYSAIGGYVPGDPATDQGCDENTALSYWTSHGIKVGGNLHKIAGSISVNAADAEEVRIAIWLFEQVMYGVGLPDAWVNPFPSADGFTFRVAGPADPSNGHCFGAMGYGSSTSKIATWAMWGEIEDNATAKYAVADAGGQLFTVLSHDSIVAASQRAPNGLDYTQLVADLQALH